MCPTLGIYNTKRLHNIKSVMMQMIAGQKKAEKVGIIAKYTTPPYIVFHIKDI